MLNILYTFQYSNIVWTVDSNPSLRSISSLQRVSTSTNLFENMSNNVKWCKLVHVGFNSILNIAIWYFQRWTIDSNPSLNSIPLERVSASIDSIVANNARRPGRVSKSRYTHLETRYDASIEWAMGLSQ